MEWIAQWESILEEREKIPLPGEYALLVQLLTEHKEALSESEQKQPDYVKITKKAKRKPLDRRGSSRRKGQDMKMIQRAFANPTIEHLSNRWQQLWLLLLDRQRRIQEKLDEIRISKASAEFSWKDWRDRYNSWLHDSKSRVLDMWRKKDADKDNKLTRDQFINAISDTNFPAERWEIELVFDKHKRGTLITYQDFMDALKGRKRKPDKPKTEAEEIHDIIGEEVAKCRCEHKFTMSKVEEGKYRFGETQKLRLVRILRSNVMIRVGGGWESLIEFLEKNDPCRATESEAYRLRESFVMPENASQSMQAFKSKPSSRGGSRPSLSREGSGSGIPVSRYRMQRERSGLGKGGEGSDHHCHSHAHGSGSHHLSTPESMTRRKSDLESKSKSLPINVRSSGYGITYPTQRKKRDSDGGSMVRTPSQPKIMREKSGELKSPTKPRTDRERSGDVYSRLYGTARTTGSKSATLPAKTTSRSSTGRSSSEKEPKSRTPTEKTKTSRTSTSAAATDAESPQTRGASIKPRASNAGVFERLATQGTATRRGSSVKEGAKKSTETSKKRSTSTKKK